MTKKPRGLILDLDQTMVDSRCAKTLRSQRDWRSVDLLIPRFIVAPGAIELGRIEDLKIAVVTKSPATYARKVLQHFGIRSDALVGYHDASPRKPHPAPTAKALELLNLSPHDVWAAGDHADDLLSARAAGISVLIGVTDWTDSEAGLALARPTVTVRHLGGVVELLRRPLKQP